MSGRTAQEAHAHLVGEATAFIERHLGDSRLTTADIAAELYVSVRQLERAVREIRGETVHGYLTRMRLERALALLRSDPALAVRQVAPRVGYGSGAALAKAIRRTFGKPPHELREEEPA